MTRFRRSWALPFLLLVSACATLMPAPGSFSPQPPGTARIILYREIGYYDPATTVTISLNGAAIEPLPRGEAIYRDVPAGTYRVTFTPTRYFPNQFSTVNVAAGGVAYVKIEDLTETVCDSGGLAGGCDAAGYVSVAMDPAQAQSEIRGLRIVQASAAR